MTSPANDNKYLGKQIMAIACLNRLGAFHNTKTWMPFTRLFVMSYCGLLAFVDSMDDLRPHLGSSWQNYIRDKWINHVGIAVANKHLVSCVKGKRGEKTIEYEYQLSGNGRDAAATLQSVWPQQGNLDTLEKDYVISLIEVIKKI